MKKRRIKYLVGNTGSKYPYYHPDYSCHPIGTKRYLNYETDRDSPKVYALPKDEYPYTVEYEKGL